MTEETRERLMGAIKIASRILQAGDFKDRYPDPVERMQQLWADASREVGIDKATLTHGLYRYRNLSRTDWEVGNIEDYDFSGSILDGGDFSRVHNFDRAVFDFRTSTIETKLPEGLSWSEVKFREFDPNLLPISQKRCLNEVDFGDLDVTGIDFSPIAKFDGCDMSQVHNIKKAKFPRLGQGGKYLSKYTRVPDEENIKLPLGVSYPDLCLRPCRFPVREWLKYMKEGGI